MERVPIDRNDYLNMQIRHATRLHAEAPTRENSEEFRLTPAQAVLVWWAMQQLEHALQGSARWIPASDKCGYADDLRCHADAMDWSNGFRTNLLMHIKAHKLEVACGD